MAQETPKAAEPTHEFPLTLHPGDKVTVSVDGATHAFEAVYEHIFHGEDGLLKHAREALGERYPGLKVIVEPKKA